MTIPHLLLEGKLLVSLTSWEYREYNGSLISNKLEIDKQISLLHILL